MDLVLAVGMEGHVGRGIRTDSGVELGLPPSCIMYNNKLARGFYMQVDQVHMH